MAAAAAAKSLQLCLTLCDPIDGSPPGSSVPGILQARILEWVAIFFSNACMHAKSLQQCLTLCDPMEHLFKNFPQFIVIHTVKGFGIVNKTETDLFLELSCFFDDSYVGNLISGSSAFSKTSLNIWKVMVHILLKPGLENFEHCQRMRWVQLCGSLNILWHCLSLGLE